MSRYATGDEWKKVAAAFRSPGTPEIGRMEPTHETKRMGWRVLLVDGQMYACATHPGGGISAAETIDGAQLGMYVDDERAALKALSDAMTADAGEVSP